MADTITAILLIVVPIAFNVAFLALGRAFDYPDILRREPAEILRRFHAGGARVVLVGVQMSTLTGDWIFVG